MGFLFKYKSVALFDDLLMPELTLQIQYHLLNFMKKLIDFMKRLKIKINYYFFKLI
jgi:hypothetical protein